MTGRLLGWFELGRWRDEIEAHELDGFYRDAVAHGLSGTAAIALFMVAFPNATRHA